MLVLSRKAGERIVIGGDVTVVVQRIGGGRVSLAIEAPREISVLRGELTPFDEPRPGKPGTEPEGIEEEEPLHMVFPQRPLSEFMLMQTARTHS